MGFFGKLFGASAPAKPRIVVEQRDWVMAYEVPIEPGWERRDDERDGDGWHLQELKYFRSEGTERIFLLAKDYSGPEASPDSLADLEARDWRAQYAKVFEVTGLEVSRGEQLLMDRTVPAVNIVCNGNSADGPQRIRERYAVVPGHKLIITAAGTLGFHERFSAEIDRWFSLIAFRPATHD